MYSHFTSFTSKLLIKTPWRFQETGGVKDRKSGRQVTMKNKGN